MRLEAQEERNKKKKQLYSKTPRNLTPRENTFPFFEGNVFFQLEFWHVLFSQALVEVLEAMALGGGNCEP